MKILRTPDERFKDLPDYPFKPHYLTLKNGARMHYVEEGRADGELVLLLHGEPTWSYLYRKMIPVFVKAGYRVIAPDLIGFGKSDKFSKVQDYSYERHMHWLNEFMDTLDL
ncbi:MAG: alpha/beta fold hydrolase, partial [Limnobacter sp.]|nr:alpha/beta fold hydrolase [Limnobacter sp.]